MDPAIIEKYLKLRALAERGEGGEKDNARRAAERMERKHEGLREAAEHFQRAAEAQGMPDPWSAFRQAWEAAEAGEETAPEDWRGIWDAIKPEDGSPLGERIVWGLFDRVFNFLGDPPDTDHDTDEEDDVAKSKSARKKPTPKRRRRRNPKRVDLWLKREGVDLEVWEDDEADDELVIDVTLSWPLKLWEKLDSEDAAQELLDFLRANITTALEEIEDYDDDGDGEEDDDA